MMSLSRHAQFDESPNVDRPRTMPILISHTLSPRTINIDRLLECLSALHVLAMFALRLPADPAVVSWIVL